MRASTPRNAVFLLMDFATRAVFWAGAVPVFRRIPLIVAFTRISSVGDMKPRDLVDIPDRGASPGDRGGPQAFGLGLFGAAGNEARPIDRHQLAK